MLVGDWLQLNILQISDDIFNPNINCILF